MSNSRVFKATVPFVIVLVLMVAAGCTQIPQSEIYAAATAIAAPATLQSGTVPPLPAQVVATATAVAVPTEVPGGAAALVAGGTPAATLTTGTAEATSAAAMTTAAPEATSTEMPTATLEPTATEAPTLAPTATEAPTLAPTATEVPTLAPTATEVPTLAPTATEAPTATTAPTVTPFVAPTSAATASPEATAAATQAAGTTAGATPEALTYQRVQIGQTGLSVEIPSGWQQQGAEMTWAAPGGNGPRVGVNWSDITGGWTESSMLPNHGRVLNTATVDLGWVKAGDYTVEITNPAASGGGVQGYERHVIVQVGGKRAYDFFMAGQSIEQLNQFVPVLEHILGSIQISQ